MVVNLWILPSVCIMHEWICSTCWCISASVRIYQSILPSSFAPPLRGAVSGFGERLLWAAVQTDADGWAHNTDSLLKAWLYGMATVSFGHGHGTVTGLAITYVCVSPHFPKATKFDQPSSSTNTDRKPKHHEYYEFHYQVWFHVSAARWLIT